MTRKPIECKSEEGITVDLIDAVNVLCKMIAPRDLTHPEVRETLKDLLFDVNFHVVCYGLSL